MPARVTRGWVRLPKTMHRYYYSLVSSTLWMEGACWGKDKGLDTRDSEGKENEGRATW